MPHKLKRPSQNSGQSVQTLSPSETEGCLVCETSSHQCCVNGGYFCGFTGGSPVSGFRKSAKNFVRLLLLGVNPSRSPNKLSRNSSVSLMASYFGNRPPRAHPIHTLIIPNPVEPMEIGLMIILTATPLQGVAVAVEPNASLVSQFASFYQKRSYRRP